MRNLTHRWPQSGHFFLQIRAFLSDFLTRAGRPSPSPSSYAPASTTCIYVCQQQEDRRRCEVCSKLRIKTLESRYWCRAGVFIVDLTTDYFFFRYLQVVVLFSSSLDNAERPYFVEITVICKINYFSLAIIKMLN